MGGDEYKLGNFRYWEILGRYFCIWRCQNKGQGPRDWGNIVEVSLDRFCSLGTVGIYLYNPPLRPPSGGTVRPSNRHSNRQPTNAHLKKKKKKDLRTTVIAQRSRKTIYIIRL